MLGAPDARHQLWILLLAALGVPAIIFTYGAWTGYHAVHKAADQNIERTREIAREHALKVFETVERTIAQVEEIVRRVPDADLRADEGVLHIRFKQIVENSDHIKSVWVIDSTGRAIANNLTYPAPDIDFSDRAYFSAHVKNFPRIYIGEVLNPRPPYAGAPFFSISQRRPTPEDNFNGVIQVSILPQYFEEFYARIAKENGAYLALLRDDGRLLARYPIVDGDRTGVSLNPQSELARAMKNNSDSGLVTSRSTVDGVTRRMSYARLPNYPAYVVVGQDVAAISQTWLWWIGGYLVFGLPATAALIAVILLAHRRNMRLFAEEARRRSAEAALRQSQRLEGLGQLTGGVAHDFNNLLMVIGGAVRQLKIDPSGPKGARALGMIETATGRAASLTQKLLSFARQRTLSPRTVEVGAFVDDFMEVVRRSLRADIALDYRAPAGPLRAHVDPDELGIALLNLCVNARDAMPDGGKLVVSVAGAMFPQNNGAGSPSGQAIAVSVADSGVGIPPEHLDRLFEPFFTTKAPEKGTGLGLSQVYGFAKQSGGIVTVHSTPGAGTTFIIYLPRQAENVATTVQDTIGKLNIQAGERVLLVEDNEEVAEVATAYLEDLGYQVDHVPNANDALCALRDSKPFQLVVSDIVMPGGLNGLDLARTIRAHHPELPVILASGYSESASTAKEEGFSLLTKPYSPAALVKAIAGTRSEKSGSATA